MKNIKYKRLFIMSILGVFVFMAADSFAQQDEEVGFIKRLFRRFIKRGEVAAPEKKPAEPSEKAEVKSEEKEPLRELTAKEIAKKIIEALDRNIEVLDFIPGLKMEKDEKGNTFYTYMPEGGIAKRLEELDKITLKRIFNRIIGEINRLNNERLIRQLEQIRRTQQPFPKQPPQPPATPAIPSPPPQPPRVYTPPQVPSRGDSATSTQPPTRVPSSPAPPRR